MQAVAFQQAIQPEPNAITYDRDQLILEHMSLVTAIAAHIQRSVPVHIELDDLVHAGMMGLFDAATKYQTEKKVAFPTYAKHRIRGAILDSLRQLDWASRDLRRRYKQVESVTQELSTKLQREPTEQEIAQQIGLDSKRWQTLMIDFRSLGIAATQARGTREEKPLQETVSAPGHRPDETYARSELRAKLGSAMETLPKRYQQVMKLYYERDLTMKEIGGILGVNESRVSQIHKSALERMQTALLEKGIASAEVF